MTRKEIISKLSREHYTFGYAPGNIHPRTVRVLEDGQVVGRRVLETQPLSLYARYKTLADGCFVGDLIMLCWDSDIEKMP